MNPQPFFSRNLSSRLSRSPSETSPKTSYRWHLCKPTVKPTSHRPRHRPRHQPNHENGEADVPRIKPVLTVVLLGWLGSQQKHLKKYADWYNSQGINAVTFTLSAASIITFDFGEKRIAKKAEENIANLTDDLSLWLAEKTEVQNGTERQLIFHMFSNTGWLTYGVLLDQLSSRGNWRDKIKGCVVDSAPAPPLDPHVWATAFLEAFSRKRSVKSDGKEDSGTANSRHTASEQKSKRTVAESVSRALLKKFFVVSLQLPGMNNRLSQLTTILLKQQPPCPQLYLYSSADKIIPKKLVESFMRKQRERGHVIVRGFNFQTSPHVDHFRNAPERYTGEIRKFLRECLHVQVPKLSG